MFTITKFDANDPEATSGGSGADAGDYFRYPPTRVMNIGLRVTY